MAQQTGKFTTKAKAVVEIGVAHEIKAQQLHEALDRILKLGGCPACGLLGFDIHFRGGDPELARAVQGIEGVQFADVVSERAG